MEYTAIQKNLGHTPRKLRLVADMIRKMTPEKALLTLEFTNKAASVDLIKAIKTALANAGKKENLSFKKIEINEGMKMKRLRVGTAGRGRGRPYKRRLSHIKIVLTDELNIKAQMPNTKIDKKRDGNEKGVEQTKKGPDDLAVGTAKEEKVESKSV